MTPRTLSALTLMLISASFAQADSCYHDCPLAETNEVSCTTGSPDNNGRQVSLEIKVDTNTRARRAVIHRTWKNKTLKSIVVERLISSVTDGVDENGNSVPSVSTYFVNGFELVVTTPGSDNAFTPFGVLTSPLIHGGKPENMMCGVYR